MTLSNGVSRRSIAVSGDRQRISVKSVRLSGSLAIDSGIAEDGSSHIAGGVARVDSKTMGLGRPLAVVRITKDSGTNMAHSVRMESHSGAVRLGLSLPVAGETTGAGGGGKVSRDQMMGELGLRRSLSVMD